ncbi:MAG: TadE/TadG family type IV pilus assembly protein [Methylocella sp.]
MRAGLKSLALVLRSPRSRRLEGCAARLPNRDISTGSMGRDKRGSVAIEFALIGSALVLLLMAATDLSLAIRARAEVGNAARAGQEFAAINGWDAPSGANIQTAATSATSLPGVTATPSTFCGCATASGITQLTCGSACAAGGTTGTYITVTVQGKYSPLFPTQWNKYLINKFVDLSATETTRSQ